VKVTWTHATHGASDAALTNDGDGTWSLSVSLDNSLSSMTYTIKITDSSGNIFTGSLMTVAITDNDAPVLSDIAATPVSQLIGGNVKTSATITDNIGLGQKYVRIDGPAGFTPINQSMTLETGDTYSYEQAYTLVGTYNYTIWAKDTSSNAVTSTIHQYTLYSEIKITATLPGWNFVSLPFNQTITKDHLFVKVGEIRYTWQEAVDANIVIDRWYDFLRVEQQYAEEDITDIVPGHGYWIYTYAGCEIWATDLVPFQSTPYITLLKVGWNIVGIPHDQIVNKADLVVNLGGTDYAWADASSYVMKDIFGWQRTLPQQYFIAETLSPGDSYWIYAFTECTLKRPST